MPRFLFTLTRQRTITDVLEIPVQAFTVHEAKQKLQVLRDSEDYIEEEYLVDTDDNIQGWGSPWAPPFKILWSPEILNN